VYAAERRLEHRLLSAYRDVGQNLYHYHDAWRNLTLAIEIIFLPFRSAADVSLTSVWAAVLSLKPG